MMRFDIDLDRWTAGWRGPLLAALVALVAGLPGLIAMPVLDRDEARFAQASAQMLESGDIVSIRFQDAPRHKKPVGAYWLQAASVSLLSAPEKREIWAFRVPSLLGAMLAAAACAWGAAAVWGPRRGALSGALLAGGLLLSTEAFIAKADAALTGCIILSLAALARLYAEARGEHPATGWRTRALFWAGLGFGMLIKGPIAPLVIGLTMIALALWDRRAAWMRRIGWGWGLVFLLLVVGPWAWAITVTTDGSFFTDSIAGDMLSKLREEGQEGHGAPPGLHLVLAPILAFPLTLLLPAALAAGWKWRASTGVRFALCWLVPSWVFFELAPTKLPHYVMPLYGALAWLAVAALSEQPGRIVRWIGAGLGALVAFALAGGLIYAAQEYGGTAAVAWTVIAGALLVAAGVGGGWLLLRGETARAAVAALALTIAAHAVVAIGSAPNLTPLWVAPRTAAMLARAGLDPRNGVTPGPVASAGFEEPSLVFTLGTLTELTDAQGAAEASASGRPVVVEKAQLPAFTAALRELGAEAVPAGEVRGYNYSKGDPVDLFLYRSLTPMPDPGGP